MALRYDRGELRSPIKTESGFLKAECYATRTGVFIYRDAQGNTRREYRPPNEVFAPESLATLQGVPVTDEHPPVLLTAENAVQFQKGFTGDAVEKDQNLVRANLTITDAELIGKAESGSQSEVSLGYVCDTEETPGEIDGEKYDAIQKNIRYNHLAIVKRGRAGSQVRLRVDAFDQLIEGEKVTKKIKLDEMEIELPEAEGDMVEAKLAALAAKIAELDAKVSELTGEKEAAVADACKANEEKKMAVADKEAAQAEVAKMDSKIHVAALERVAILEKAKEHLDGDFSAMSNIEIKKAVASKVFPEVKLDAAEPAFIDGLFVAAKKQVAENKPVDKLAGDLSKTKMDASGNSSEAARIRSMEQSKNAWRS